MPRKLALLVGVSRYEDERLAHLGAPAADVASLAEALGDPAIAAFDEVVPLVEPSREAVIDAVDTLCHARARDDLVLFYFSGHGIRDDRGRLFFALGRTRYERPRGTGIAAAEIKSFIDDCGSRRQVLVLDCCHAGAFMEAKAAATATPALTEDTFEVSGYGREILAATNATAYAFEQTAAKGDGTSNALGKFTRHLVDCLRNGRPDASGEELTVADLFEHARRKLAEDEPRMRPQHWRERGEAPLVIARNAAACARLPADIVTALDDANWLTRRGAVDVLSGYITGQDARLRRAALDELRRREPLEEHRRVHERIVAVLAVQPVEIRAPAGPQVAGIASHHGQPVQVFREVDAPWCPEMVVIPAGRFLMGSPKDEDGRDEDEGPQRKVTFASPFALGRYTITFEEYDAFCDATGHARADDEWGRGRQPAINVSWEDATAYCRWLAERTGKPYRLPSEAEWEYACRAGTMTPFWTGETISSDEANFDGNHVYGRGRKGGFRQRTVPVDDPAFRPNPFGLFHMHGNVWEWVEDLFHDSYEGAPTDGPSWTAGDDPRRVLRGGSWLNSPRYLRSAYRNGDAPEVRYNDAGFRVARMLTP